MYYLTRFGLQPLPIHNVVAEAGAAALAGGTKLPGARAWDVYRGEVTPPLRPIKYRYAASWPGLSPATLRARWLGILGRLGQKDLLYRAPVTGGAEQQTLARLTDVRAPTVGGTERNVRVTLEFELLDLWEGAPHTTTLGGGGTMLSVTLGGNAPALVKVVVHTGAGALNSFWLRNYAAGAWISYAPPVPIPASTALTIDARTQSVLRADVPSYEGFSLMPAHRRAEWMVLLPGLNRLELINTSGTAPTSWDVSYSATYI